MKNISGEDESKEDRVRFFLPLERQEAVSALVAPTSSPAADVRLTARSPLGDVADVPFRMGKKRKMAEKSKHQVRVTGGGENLDDGYSWRKYGQKEILGAKHPRGYYRCTYRHSHGCPAMKQVQRTDQDPTLLDVFYLGAHTCVQRPAAGQAAADTQHTDQDDVVYVEDPSCVRPSLHTEDRTSGAAATTHRIIKQSIPGVDVPEDGYSWRKYGQKEILGAKYPRSYYRCTHRHTEGCIATKQVQPRDTDPLTLEVFYLGIHTCEHTAARSTGQSSLSGCTTATTTSASTDNHLPQESASSDMDNFSSVCSNMSSNDFSFLEGESSNIDILDMEVMSAPPTLMLRLDHRKFEGIF